MFWRGIDNDDAIQRLWFNSCKKVLRFEMSFDEQLTKSQE